MAEQRAELVLSYREQIDLSTAESGVDVLRIITTDIVATQRIVLQRELNENKPRKSGDFKKAPRFLANLRLKTGVFLLYESRNVLKK